MYNIPLFISFLFFSYLCDSICECIFFILVPPVITTPKYKPVSGGKLRWIEAEDQLPDGALIGGFENEILYIVRGRHMNSLTPGKFVISEGTAYISWGGEANATNAFEVFISFHLPFTHVVMNTVSYFILLFRCYVDMIVYGYQQLTTEYQ